MVRKKVDPRLKALIESGIKNNHRSIIMMIGDHGKDQVVHLHYMLSKAQVAARPSLLWCYKKELGFSSHRKKRQKLLTKKKERGLLATDENMDENIFDRFLTTTDVRYCYYKETEKVLGQTFGMCVLQDFEALTPNLLARTIETVSGGGLIVILLKTMKSLKQLYTMTMDVHSRYRTESHEEEEIVSRFNERFLLSLSHCQGCLVLDDELNVLPISSYSRTMLSGSGSGSGSDAAVDDKGLDPNTAALKELKESVADEQPTGALVGATKSVDQAKALLDFIHVIADKNLKSTVSLTAARGRGKSAALGLAMAAAVAFGYANIFVTSPHPDNLKTLFQFIFKGFDALGYTEHQDYDMIQSTNPDLNKAIIRVNVFRGHRQTIQYIQPTDYAVLGQAELVVIDEAAAIPLPIVKRLLGPYLVFMASTINGYEGTGRSLSLKLIAQLRDVSNYTLAKSATENAGHEPSAGSPMSGRTLKELKLEEPIRYKSGDPIEEWLNGLLCLDASHALARSPFGKSGCPHPNQCQLYLVNRDTLFSYHKASEAFLQKMMSLYVASHYKNTPNDLQLMSDAPAHYLFVLLPPIDESSTALPEILVVVQVCLEGRISRSSILKSVARGQRAGGDLIPWTLSQQFQDDEFPGLSGARVVRIATHPDYQHMGYGSRALQLLEEYYMGKVIPLDDNDSDQASSTNVSNANEDNGADLHSEVIAPRAHLPPLLSQLGEKRPPGPLHWLGVAFGLSPALYRFWKRAGYVPTYIRQTTNDLTGEHSTIMLKSLVALDKSDRQPWLQLFYDDFYKRFLNLLSYQFKELPTSLALEILDATSATTPASSELSDNESRGAALTFAELRQSLSVYDLKRLESYANNMVDYHLILDLLPLLTSHYFLGRLGSGVRLSPVQSTILLSLGGQRKSLESLGHELQLASSQTLAMFVKVIRKISSVYRALQEKSTEQALETESAAVASKNGHQETRRENGTKEGLKSESHLMRKSPDNDEDWDPTLVSLEQDLEEAGQAASNHFRTQQRELINALDLQQYAIGATDDDWQATLKVTPHATTSSLVSVKSSKKNEHQALARLTAEHRQNEEKKMSKKMVKSRH